MLSRIPADVLQAVQKLLTIDDRSSIQDFTFASGGCINQGGKLRTTKGIFFLKWNVERKFPGMFEAESRGLQLLGVQHCIKIPVVTGYTTTGTHQLLLLEFIEQRPRGKNYWEQLATGLSKLHSCAATSFGLDHHNYIGSLKQFNDQASSWIDFFIEKRLNVQLRQALETHAAPLDWQKKFDALYKHLPAIIPEEKPALLHGDLWSGNLITNDKGEPCLIDPAVYYGNREADLAMTKLFGGFDDAFYSHYDEISSLQPGYIRRLDIYNLYPLLVHVNLFGSSYVPSVERILSTFR